MELCSSASHFHLQCLYSDSFDCFKKCLYFRSLDVKSIGAVSVLADEDMIQRRDFRQFPAADGFWWQLWWTLMFAYIHPFYSCPLKAYPSNIFDTMSSFPAVSRFRLPRCFRFLRGPWFIPRKLRNKMMHAKNGNTFSPFAASSGKGRGKSKNQGQRQQVFTQVTPELQEEWFQQAIKDSLPEAAQRRLAPRLEPAEWSVPTFHHTEMTNTGGICICPKQEIPDLPQTHRVHKSSSSHVVYAASIRDRPEGLPCTGAHLHIPH